MKPLKYHLMRFQSFCEYKQMVFQLNLWAWKKKWESRLIFLRDLLGFKK